MRLSALLGKDCDPDPEIKGLTSDSRAVRPGFLFAALTGHVDGAQFIPQAEQNGAVAILAKPGVSSRTPMIADPEPRKRLALMAARFFPRQPRTIVGVTGTNGKTSTTQFAAQIWTMLGADAGVIGTLGAESPGYRKTLRHTTPEQVELHEILDAMASAGTSMVAMEVSSHALDQRRADGVRFAGAAFTNLTQDHLDYHGDLDAYFNAKLRLFDEVLPSDGFAAVNIDGAGADRVVNAARARGLKVLTTGRLGETLRCVSAQPHAHGIAIVLDEGRDRHSLGLPLIGAFQVENALLAAAIAMGAGAAAADALASLERLRGVPGRMQMVAEAGGGHIFVDYAHTPDAVATALAAIRPHVENRLIVVLGAGGDRDRAKRPMMGAAAARFADFVVVTDDNPRSEEPSLIRREVLAGAPGAEEIGDRGEAIASAVARLEKGDVLVIAGKGHETGQTIGGVTSPFDDAQAARAAAAHCGGRAA